MKITDRELVLGIATMACVLFGGTWFAVNGKAAEWKTKKTEIFRLREQISRHQAAIRMQDEWLDELHELEKKLRVFDTGQRSVSPDLMKTIDIIANEHELNITKTNPQAERPTGDLFEMSLNCTWQGELDAVVGFLTKLQQQGVRYNVRTLNIKPLGKNTGKLQGNMVIDCAFTRREIAEEKQEQPADKS
jgi:Tfp pilus assembly protein PilO